MTLSLYRCEQDGRLLRRLDVARGECLGHRLKLVTQGNFLEWLRVQYWKLTDAI